MKKIMFLISLLFAVVCYAAPPPDLVPDNIAGQIEIVVQDNANAQVFTFEAQEVAFVNIGNVYSFTSQTMFAEPAPKVKVPKVLVIYFNYNFQGLSRPPLLAEINVFRNSFLMNNQNSNYGYPLTADNC